MAIAKAKKDYVNENILIYPFEELDKKLETSVLNNNNILKDEYDIESNARYQKLLYSDFSKQLYPYIEDVLDEYEYNGSVIYDKYIDRHSVFLMVTRVMENLGKSNYFRDFANSDFEKLVSSYTVLRADVETMLLSELFFIRRLKYHKEGKLNNDIEGARVYTMQKEADEIYLKNEFL
ncbi:MAG: hypothetical protein ACK5LY_09825 [Lachnospirales bacterium]